MTHIEFIVRSMVFNCKGETCHNCGYRKLCWYTKFDKTREISEEQIASTVKQLTEEIEK